MINSVNNRLLDSEELQPLMESAIEKKYLYVADLLKTLDGLDLEDEEVGQLYDALDAQNITLRLDVQDVDEEVKPVEPDVLARDFSPRDPVRMYLEEISKVPLLTDEEHSELARTVTEGVQAGKKLSYGETLTPEEQKELKRICRRGDTASQKLIEGNLRLVIAVARHYVGHGMLFMDLIQEGSLGLIKAVKEFNDTDRKRFYSRAKWWIRQSIIRALAEQNRSNRVPEHMVDLMNKVTRVRQQLLEKLGHAPTADEIAVEMNMPVEQVSEAMKIAQDTLSKDTSTVKDADSEIERYASEEEENEPGQRAALNDQLEGLLQTLPCREKEVLELHYGIADGHPYDLEEVAEKLGISDEDARVLMQKALSKLRSSGSITEN